MDRIKFPPRAFVRDSRKGDKFFRAFFEVFNSREEMDLFLEKDPLLFATFWGLFEPYKR